MMEPELVKTRHDNGVLWVTLNQPEKRNPLSSQMIGALSATLNHAYSDAQTRVIVLTAEGPVFSAGHDLTEFDAANGEDEATRSARIADLLDNCAHMMMGIVNAPIDDRLALRAGYQLARSNGFRENAYLDIDDSNRRRESLLRFKLRYATPGGFLLKSTLFRVEADNGYDMWSPDNNRGLVTYSDRLGRDHQTTTAFSLRMEKPTDRLLNWVAISTYAQTELDYSYDGDWGNDAYWGAEPYLFDTEVEGWRYD
ncbi:MAG: hypothetical protein EBT71_05050, partial [Alphaproteobacteria bacterium]|nr:hypothetical protein [Alphaproteobacteria bacterium]